MDARWRKMCLFAAMVVMCVAPVRSLESSPSLEYSITTTWNGKPVSHAPVNLSLTASPDKQHLILSVSATFFNDPPAPPGPPGQPFYGLWDYEVVEAFFLNDANQYLEVELCPWGQHIVLLLSGQRITVRHSLQLEVSTQRGDGVWSGTAAIPVSYLPEKVTKFNAYAIYGSGAARVYEALYPAPATATNPDFHALQYFKPIDLSGLLPSQATDPMSQLWSDSLQGLFRYDIATTWNDLPLSPPLVQITLQGFEAGMEMNVTAPFYNDPAPAGPPGEPFYSLWDYEVVEMFFLNKNDEYLEVELGPWGQHLLLLLQGERNAIKHSLPLDYIITERTEPVGGAPGQWKGSAMIPPEYFPPNVTLMNAYAIHGVGDARQYQSLYPAPNNDPNYPNADFHRLDLFRAIDFEFQVKDNKNYSQVWLDAMGSGASTHTQPVTTDEGEMTTLGPLRSLHTFTPESSDTFAPDSADADPEDYAISELQDNAPETTTIPEPLDDTPSDAAPSEPRESYPEIPVPPKPDDSTPEITTFPDPSENDVVTTLPNKHEDEITEPTTYPASEVSDPETATTTPETMFKESVPEISLTPKSESTDTEVTTTLPEEVHRKSVPEIPLPPKPEPADPEITTITSEFMQKENEPKVPIYPRPESSYSESTTLAPEPVTTLISMPGINGEPEPTETLPPNSIDDGGQKDNENAPNDSTTLAPTTPAPTTLPEPLEASKPTMNPGNTRTAVRRRPRPQRVNQNNNHRVSFAPQSLPVRSRGRPVPRPLRVRPNRRVGEHRVPQQGLPIHGGFHPEDFLVHLGQHLLSQHQGLEFPPPQEQQIFPRDQLFQPPRGQVFQPPRDQQFQLPRDQHFQPPTGLPVQPPKDEPNHSSRDQQLQPPRDQVFQPPIDHQFQPPISQPIQPSKDQVFQLSKDQEFQLPISQPIQPPKDQVFQPPKDQEFQFPISQPIQPPKDQVFEPPIDHQFQPPISQPIQPSKDQVFQPPKDQEFQLPISQPIQPPKDQVFQPPKDQQFQPPITQPIQSPQDQASQLPKDQGSQIPEDRQSQTSDQPLSAPQQEVHEQLQPGTPSGEQHQQHFPPSRGGGSSTGGRGKEEVGLQEVEEVITSLTEGSPALPPPHPLCFTPGLVPDERRCWVFHECELVDGQWHVYSWKCIRGHVFDPFNVACVRGRCRRRRRG